MINAAPCPETSSSLPRGDGRKEPSGTQKVIRGFLAVSLFAVSSGSLFGNGGGYSIASTNAGAFRPIDVEKIEMVKERLEIDLHLEYAEIRVEYELRNPGLLTKVEAGFPVSYSLYDISRDRLMEGIRDPASDPKKTLSGAVANHLQKFAASLDGEPIGFEVVPDSFNLRDLDPAAQQIRIEGWYKVRIDFRTRQTRTLKVTYRQRTSDVIPIAYLFSAAAIWKGPIREGLVTIRPVTRAKEDVALSHPNRFEWKGDRWEWSFRDFEPTLEDDLKINTNARGKEVIDLETRYSEGVDTTESNDGLNAFYITYGGRWTGDDYVADRWEAHHTSYRVESSSTLADEDQISYSPENLKDRNHKTSWVEGVPGDGVGETLTVTPDTPARVTHVGIATGYTATEDLYYANGRVAALDVSVNGGPEFRVSVPDERLVREYFYFELPASSEPVKSIRLKVAEVRPGTHFQDTAVSRLVLVQPLDRMPLRVPLR